MTGINESHDATRVNVKKFNYQSIFVYGHALFRSKEYAQVLDYYQGQLKDLQQLADPTMLGFMCLLFKKMGDVHAEMEHFEDGERYYVQAMECMDRVQESLLSTPSSRVFRQSRHYITQRLQRMHEHMIVNDDFQICTTCGIMTRNTVKDPADKCWYCIPCFNGYYGIEEEREEENEEAQPEEEIENLEPVVLKQRHQYTREELLAFRPSSVNSRASTIHLQHENVSFLLRKHTNTKRKKSSTSTKKAAISEAPLTVSTFDRIEQTKDEKNETHLDQEMKKTRETVEGQLLSNFSLLEAGAQVPFAQDQKIFDQIIQQAKATI